MEFNQAIKNRRSQYQINHSSPIGDDVIQSLITEALTYAPTAFNSQTGRVILLLNDQHLKLWDITKKTLKAIVPPQAFAQTEEKLNSFAAGHGTILFFEDEAVVEQLQKDFALYKDNFPLWSQQGSGILQYIVWTSLSEHGLGATLQHYNPLIDEEVKKVFEVPSNWKLIAQMPFGTPTAQPGENEHQPLEERFVIKK